MAAHQTQIVAQALAVLLVVLDHGTAQVAQQMTGSYLAAVHVPGLADGAVAHIDSLGGRQDTAQGLELGPQGLTAPQFLKDLELSDEELVKVIIGAIGGMDSYQLPDAKGYTSMVRYLTGITDEARQEYRDQLLATTQEDFKDFASILERAKNAGNVVVLGSEDAINAANEKLGKKEKLNIIKVM